MDSVIEGIVAGTCVVFCWYIGRIDRWLNKIVAALDDIQRAISSIPRS